MSEDNKGRLKGAISNLCRAVFRELENHGAEIQNQYKPIPPSQARELNALFKDALTQRLGIFEMRLSVLDQKLLDYVRKINQDSELKAGARDTFDENLADALGVVLPTVVRETYTQNQMDPFLTSIDRFADSLASAGFPQSASMVMVVFGGCLGRVFDPKIQTSNQGVCNKYLSLVETQFKKVERGPNYNHIGVLQTCLCVAFTRVSQNIDRANQDRIVRALYLRVDRSGQHHSL